jgi:hypothetical protein
MMFHHGYGYGPGWIIVAIIAVIPFWRICKRIGYSPWLSLLILVPLVNLIFIYVLAFSQWPSERGTAAGGGTPNPTPT